MSVYSFWSTLLITDDKMTFKEMLISWLCGVQSTKGDEYDRGTERQTIRDEQACSLEQRPCIRYILNLLAVFVALVGVAMFLFWSLWKYHP